MPCRGRLEYDWWLVRPFLKSVWHETTSTGEDSSSAFLEFVNPPLRFYLAHSDPDW